MEMALICNQLVRDLKPFQRFLPIAAQSSGQIINFSQIGRDVGVAPQTAEGYFQILEDTLLGFHLPSYHPSLRKQERMSSKFYLFDIGVLRALLRTIGTTLQSGTYAFGRAFEHFVIREIISLSSYQRKNDEFYYYATHGGREIDLVIDRGSKEKIFIEIKSKDNISAEDIRHLEAISSEKKLKDSSYYCLSLDKNAKKFGNVLCLPWQEGLKELGLITSN